MISFNTQRLLLRRPAPSDLPAYTAYCTSSHSTMVGGPFPVAAAFEKLALMIGHWDLRGFGRLVFCDAATLRPLGHVGALQLDSDHPPEISWTLWSAQDQGQGYAYEAARAYLDDAKAARQFDSLLARIKPENARSVALALRLGGVWNPAIPAPPWFADSASYEFSLVA
jgi:ribosomal-protein-alanine N-acetyltransferase